MRKLLIVEDEQIIRKALVALPWEQLGITDIVEAADGREGLSCYMEHRPQVVLLDINMPFMDGITLGKKIAEQQHPCQISFLTGYSEFTYAQAAISLKAFDYILKPVDAAVLLPQVRNAFQAVEEELLAEQASIESQRRTWIKQVLLSQRQPIEASMDQLFSVTGPYQCMCFFMKRGELPFPKQFNKELLLLEDNTYFALVDLSQYEADFAEWVGGAELEATLSRHKGWIGLSTIGKNRHQLVDKILEARTSFEQARFESPGVSQFQGQKPKKEFPVVLQELSDKLNQAIGSRAPKQAYELLESIERTGSLMTLPLSQLRPFVMKQVFLLLQSAHPSIVCDEFAVYQKVSSSTSLTELLQPMMSLLDSWKKAQDTEGKSETIIQQAKRFIDSHYADEGISLQMVAENIHVSPPYLSNLFKSETGANYTEYLFGRRMREAYYLLEQTDKSITDISLETGFANANYFSSCFKKESGMSPKHYRKKFQEEHKSESTQADRLRNS